MPEHRVELRIGDVTLRILKITRSRAGDVYVMPPTLTGLHLSHHASGKRHVRDELGYHRDFVEPTAEADLEEIAKLLLYEPAPDASLVVLRPVGPLPEISSSEGKVATIAIELMLKALDSYQLVRIAGRQFGELLHATRGQRLIIVDETAKQLVSVDWREGVPIPLHFPLDFDEFRKEVSGTAFGQGMLEPILAGLDRAYAKVQESPELHPFADLDFEAIDAQLSGALSKFMDAWNGAQVLDLSARPPASETVDGPAREEARGPSHASEKNRTNP